MELTTQVRIHRSVAASDVSASCSNHACSLAVVIWTYTFAVAIFSSDAIFMFPCRMFFAHSHRARIKSGSACSSIAFRSFAFLVSMSS